MSTRKRWSVELIPTFTRTQFPSRAAAYRYVAQHSRDRALGLTRITDVTVRVSEGRGPWQTYERLHFDPPTFETDTP